MQQAVYTVYNTHRRRPLDRERRYTVFIAQCQLAKSSGVNVTQVDHDDEDEADEVLENMNFAEFKERYRRLIPYMTYYVANNYVNPQVLGFPQQHQQSTSYEREKPLAMSPLIRKPQRLVSVGRPTDPRRKPNRHAAPNPGSLHKQEDKFVPSVQYDPKDIGADANYFTPVRHTQNLNYDTLEYSGDRVINRHRDYDVQQQRPVVYSEPTSPAPTHLRYVKSRPSSRPYNPLHDRTHTSSTQKLPVAGLHLDYLPDYGSRTTNNQRPIGGSDYTYPAGAYESLRYVEAPLRAQPKPTRILAQSPPTRPLSQSFAPVYSRRPADLTLEDIMKSLQLTNRLPEMLNKDNVDSSIRTLVEILSLLHNAKQSNQPRLPVAEVASEPYRPVPISEVPNEPYRPVAIRDHYKPVHNRPKVITETRFQATPSPPLLPIEQMFSHKPGASYETEIDTKLPQNAVDGAVDKANHHDAIEYYTPLIQDLDEVKTNSYGPKNPEKLDKQIDHGFEDSGDYAEDILETEKYTLPITTETPFSKYQLPNGVSKHTHLVPPTTLKYGATRGKPNVDYPAHAAIPETEFNCKEQRYKGFFGDPSTGCQVWHYCDLNGGKSSFLCPNGTIFSQVALTCDWWFNVKCESTTQLYVLNERLYKYILPVMPKFPEDFSGPEVDRYLELKFKEMEAKLKEKKLKKQLAKDKIKEKLQALDSEE